jgi:cytochrome P450
MPINSQWIDTMPLTYQHLSSPSFSANPFDLLATYREIEPITWSDELQSWVFFKHEDVKHALYSDQFTNNREVSLSFPGYDNLLPNLRLLFEDSAFSDNSEAAHIANRKMTIRVFNPRAIERLRENIGRVVNKKLLCLTNGNKHNFYGAVEEAPFEIMRQMLGVPDMSERKRQFIDSCKIMSDVFNPLLSDEKKLECNNAIGEVSDEIRRLIEERKNYPKDDLITSFYKALPDYPGLNETHIVVILSALITSGTRGILHGITMAIKTIYDHPGQLQLLQENPSLLSSTATELMRYSGTAKFLYRYVAEDILYKGHELKRGQTVMLSTISANRDESVFTNSDTLDITRSETELRKSLTFGHGHHFCLGAHLAIAQIEEVLRFFVEHVPAGAVDVVNVEYADDFLTRSISSLPIKRPPGS